MIVIVFFEFISNLLFQRLISIPFINIIKHLHKLGNEKHYFFTYTYFDIHKID